MGSFLMKIVVIVIIVLAVIALVNKFSGAKEKPKAEQKTFYDVIEEDDKRLRADIEPNKPSEANETTLQQSKGIQTEDTEPIEVTAEEQVQAERLFEMAITQRKMARLPGMTYKQMVDYCRQIIEQYPNSPEAPKARRMLGEVPRQDWERYKITEQEVNPSK